MFTTALFLFSKFILFNLFRAAIYPLNKGGWQSLLAKLWWHENALTFCSLSFIIEGTTEEVVQLILSLKSL
jgi:hypothetical protein